MLYRNVAAPETLVTRTSTVCLFIARSDFQALLTTCKVLKNAIASRFKIERNTLFCITLKLYSVPQVYLKWCSGSSSLSITELGQSCNQGQGGMAFRHSLHWLQRLRASGRRQDLACSRPPRTSSASDFGK